MTKLNLKNKPGQTNPKYDIKVRITGLGEAIETSVKLSSLYFDWEHIPVKDDGEMTREPNVEDVILVVEENACGPADACEMLGLDLYDLIDLDKLEIEITKVEK